MRTLSLIALTGTLLGIPLLPKLSAPPLVKVQASELSSWTLIALSRTKFVAVQQSTGTGVSPYFEAVELGRVSAGTVVPCGDFPRPTLKDNGLARSWEYFLSRPSSGPCASVIGNFVATGRRGSTQTRTAEVP